MQTPFACFVEQGLPRGRTQCIGQAHAVADAPRAQARRLDDARRRVGLAGMAGDGQAGVACQRKGCGVQRRRVAGLGPGEVQAHDTLRAVTQRQPRDAFALAGRMVADRADDQAAGQRAACQPRQQRFDRGLGRHAEAFPQMRCTAQLGEHAAVGQCIFGGLEGHTFECRHAGHRGNRQAEALQIGRQAAGVGTAAEPLRQRVGVVDWQGDAACAGQFDQRGGTQAAVQMFVQQHLGQGARCRGDGVVGCCGVVLIHESMVAALAFVLLSSLGSQ